MDTKQKIPLITFLVGIGSILTLGAQTIPQTDSLSSSLPLIIIGVVLLMTAAIVVLNLWSVKKRRESMENFDQESGLQYAVDDRSFSTVITESSRFEIFQRGRRRTASNLLRGYRSGIEVSIFDYRFTTGSGKNRHVHQQTILLLTLSDARLEPFRLRPQHLLDKIATTFGQQDINFPDQPEFSKRYRLQGENESAIRSVFSLAVMEFFEQQSNQTVEAGDNQILFYTAGRLLKTEVLLETLDKAIQLAHMLRRSTPQSGADGYGYPR